MPTRQTKIILWFILIIFIITISVIDARTYIPLWFRVQDKFVHLIVFFVFFLYTRLLFPQWPVWFTLLFSTVTGIFTETLQLLFTQGHRRFDLIDITWNMYGILLAWLVLGVWRLWHKRRQAG
jgi:hypothetical protein